MTTYASLCEGPIFYFMSFTLCKSQGDLHLSLFHFILWQAPRVGKDPDIYIQLDVSYHELLLLTLPLR